MPALLINGWNSKEAKKAASISAKTDFTLGADPEFGFLEKNGHLIHADDIIIDDDFSEGFGLDGSNCVAEIRPSPSCDPAEVVGNIRNIFVEGVAGNSAALAANWKAGSDVDGSAIGGHIHFGLRFAGISYNTSNVLMNLDNFLAYPVILLENPNEAKSRRCNTSYGQLSDHRGQDWGIEYRTLGSWLTSPYIALGVLCLAKAIVWETIHNGLELGSNDMRDTTEFNRAKFSSIRTKVEKYIWKEILKFELYSKYRRPIDFLWTLISKHRNWFPESGMKTSWAVGTFPSSGLIRKTSLKSVWKGVR